MNAPQQLLAFLDIETLSTRLDAKVLSMAITTINPPEDYTFPEIVERGIQVKFSLATQEHRHTSKQTVKWWSEQSEEAQKILAPSPDDIHYEDFYKALEEWASPWVMQKWKWFSRGPHFDIAIMDSLFATSNITPPWKFWNVRDIRTWLECNGLPDNLKLEEPEGFIHHNALHDAAYDAWMMLQIIHNHPLNIKQHRRSA